MAITGIAGLVAALASAIPIFAPLEFSPPPPREEPVHVRPATVPTDGAIAEAAEYAAARGGAVSFAVIDSRGRLRGHDAERLYSAASTVKAMVLAAELRRMAAAGEPVDDSSDALLGAMIRYSDNEAADAVYARVGDAGMTAVAEGAGMTNFQIAGHWGNAQVTAADMARFFGDLEGAFPRRHLGYAQNLLGSVIASQSWGIPAVAGADWGVRFKGGWLPDHALVHQAAELRERGGPREIAVAILTDEQPSHGYGVETLEGVAARLLRED